MCYYNGKLKKKSILARNRTRDKKNRWLTSTLTVRVCWFFDENKRSIRYRWAHPVHNSIKKEKRKVTVDFFHDPGTYTSSPQALYAWLFKEERILFCKAHRPCRGAHVIIINKKKNKLYLRWRRKKKINVNLFYYFFFLASWFTTLFRGVIIILWVHCIIQRVKSPYFSLSR